MVKMSQMSQKNRDCQLFYSAQEGAIGKVRRLLAAGAVMDFRDEDGATALHAAVVAGHEDVAALLLEKGVDAEARDNKGDTPLQHAAECRSLGVVEVLLRAGADVGTRNGEGETPLHRAVIDGLSMIVAILLDAGADPNAKTDKGVTPLHVVAQHLWHKKTFDLLLAAGADPTIPDVYKNIPGDYCMDDEVAVFFRRAEEEWQSPERVAAREAERFGKMAREVASRQRQLGSLRPKAPGL